MNRRYFPMLIASVLPAFAAGCVSMRPPDLPASHPANPEAPQAPLVLRTQIEPYQQSGAATGAQEHKAGMDHSMTGHAGMDHAQKDEGAPGGHAHDGGHAQDSSSAPPGYASSVQPPASQNQPTRTVRVTALDSMRFEPQTLQVRAGETIRFVVTNAGKLPHEFVVGDRREQQEHEEMMKKMPDMRHEHDNALSLAPGQTKTLVWRFDKPGTYELGCHVPGHYEAGMVSTAIVTAEASPERQRAADMDSTHGIGGTHHAPVQQGR